jgi:hypothetical protein
MAVTRGRSNSSMPAEDCFPITTSDSVDLEVNTRALVIAVGGAVKFTTESGQTRTCTFPAGVIPIRVSRVWATGTTATGISGLV